MDEIIIWDIDAHRIMRLHANLTKALCLSGLKANITCNSEPPLLSRLNLLNRVPLIEINSQYWSCGANKEISVETFGSLLKNIIDT